MSIKHNYSNYTGIKERVARLPHVDVHAGSWFGLPDFGITEAIGGLLGAPRTAQGGSNVLGAPTQQDASTISPPIVIVPSGVGTNQQSVLGTNTYASSPVTQVAQPSAQTQAQNNVNTQQDALRNMINSGFNDLVNQYNSQAGLLPGWQQQDESALTDTYNKTLGGLQDSLANANKSLGLDKQQVQQGVDKSVSDIQNSLRALLKNAQGLVGSYGAGSSSVAQQLVPYAFSKMYAQQRGNIQGQANSQFTDLAKKGLDVQNNFNTQKMQLDQWENQNLTQTRDKYRQMLTDINNAKANATGARAQALQQLQAGILQQAQNELSSIQQEAANQRQMILQATLNQQQQLPSLQQQLADAAQYSVSPIAYQQLSGLSGGQDPNSYNFLNPLALQQKKDQNQ